MAQPNPRRAVTVREYGITSLSTTYHVVQLYNRMNGFSIVMLIDCRDNIVFMFGYLFHLSWKNTDGL